MKCLSKKEIKLTRRDIVLMTSVLMIRQPERKKGENQSGKKVFNKSSQFQYLNLKTKSYYSRNNLQSVNIFWGLKRFLKAEGKNQE